MSMLDGNVLAGALGEVFAVDLTAADGCCAGCGLVGPLAAWRVYGAEEGPGFVARCPGCEGVMLRLVRHEDAAVLDLRGAMSLRIPL
jgi:hypothetical protein